jgi:hypothetical protein
MNLHKHRRGVAGACLELACGRSYGNAEQQVDQQVAPEQAAKALLSLAMLPFRAGVVVAWIFNLWGAADLLDAFYQADHAGLVVGQLGAAYFLPTLVVPLLLITHALTFRILLRHPK